MTSFVSRGSLQEGCTQPKRGHLLHNLILFGRLLRGCGLDINPGRMITLVRALEHIDMANKEEFYHAARCLLVHEKEDIPIFDQAFSLFWRRPDDSVWALALPRIERESHHNDPAGELRTPEMHPTFKNDRSTSDEEQETFLEATQTYSVDEALRYKDFADLTGDEIAAIKRLMAQLIWNLGQRRTRRRRPGSGLAIDIRRSFRHSVRYGGEIIAWSYREKKYRPRPLVIIADISGSMERYTRMLLHFIYGLSTGLEQQVEAFVFSTRLTRVTRYLRNRDVDLALQQVSIAVPDWSSGTRTGDALKHFNYEWARRVLGRGAVVLVISDGWDRGDPQLLAGEMARLQRSCHRLIWLNPLLGLPDYKPLTRGMQAALPFVDDFLPVHNLASLEDLAEKLENLGERRPVRRQQGLINRVATSLA